MRRVLLLCRRPAVSLRCSHPRGRGTTSSGPQPACAYYATRPPEGRRPPTTRRRSSRASALLVKRRRALLYVAYFALGVAPAKAVHHDKWTALRQKPADLGGIRTKTEAGPGDFAIRGHRLLAARRGARGTHAAGAGQVLRAPLEPSIGFGVGTKLAARYAHREWLPCLVLGWYAGGPLWDVLDVKPPAWNKGVPIVVNRVRPGWKWPTRGGALIQPGVWEQGGRASRTRSCYWICGRRCRARGRRNSGCSTLVLRDTPHRRRRWPGAAAGPGRRRVSVLRTRSIAATPSARACPASSKRMERSSSPGSDPLGAEHVRDRALISRLSRRPWPRRRR